MKIIDAGHKYELTVLDGLGAEYLTFVKRNNPPSKFPGNDNAYFGTTTQEVVRALIDRAKYVENQIPHYSNLVAINLLRQVIYLYEQRAASRHGRVLRLSCEELLHIEELPVCSACGHLKPEFHLDCL